VVVVCTHDSYKRVSDADSPHERHKQRDVAGGEH